MSRQKVGQFRAEFKSKHNYRPAPSIAQCCEVCVYGSRPDRRGAYRCEKQRNGIVAWNATCDLQHLAEGMETVIEEHEAWEADRVKRQELKQKFYVSREDAVAAIKKLTKTHAKICRCVGCKVLNKEREWVKHELGESK